MDDGANISDKGRRPRGVVRRVARPAASLPGRGDPQIEAIVGARHGDPFGYLGMREEDGKLVVRAMLPGAESVSIIDRETGSAAGNAEQLHPDGFFTARLDRKERFAYRLRAVWGGVAHEFDDAFSFPPVLGD